MNSNKVLPLMASTQTVVMVWGALWIAGAPAVMTGLCVVAVAAMGVCCWTLGACQGMKETRDLFTRSER